VGQEELDFVVVSMTMVLDVIGIASKKRKQQGGAGLWLQV